MNIKKVQDADVSGKKVLLRVDFNVSLENGHAKETFKIEAAKESLDYLLNKKAKVALLSYFGRPGGKVVSEFSMKNLISDAGRVLGVKIKFVPDCVGTEVGKGVDALADGEILLLENARFYPGEDENDENLARQMAAGFDIFVNDAFSQSHRDQASITGITKFLPSYAGFQLQKEMAEMEKVKNNFARPSVAIIGGAKIETKLPVIKFFEEKYDYVLVGGKIANEAIDQKINFGEKVILPIDFIDDRLDIGPRTVESFKKIISQAKTIVWNGPLGKFEEEKYARGTYEILDAILTVSEKNGAYVVIGGGETLEALEKREATSKISFVSTGGGAMLSYLGGETMPGVDVLEL
jgi:phosphoglycerate kinase